MNLKVNVCQFLDIYREACLSEAVLFSNQCWTAITIILYINIMYNVVERTY